MARLCLITFLLIAIHGNSQSITISGVVTEKSSQETIPYVNIRNLNDSRMGSTSNSYGFYSLTLQSNITNQLIFSHIGHESFVLTVNLSSDTTINVVLVPLTLQLNEIVINADPGNSGLLNYHQLNIEVIKQIPALLGEKDIFKALQLLPGVQRGVEGSNVFYVRGGGADQNLVILDDATVYNANHLFGFMSVFNSDAIKNLNFYKGSFPARYGGRIASVTDIQMKEGNREKIKAEGGIGILSGRLTVDGPIRKDKSSFIVSARRSFLDLFTKPFMSDNNKVGYRLYDVSLKANFNEGSRDRFFISGYIGGDKLDTRQKTVRQQSVIKSDTDLGWTNRTASVRWNHIFSDKLFANTSLVYSHYNFFLTDTYIRTGTNANLSNIEFNSLINDYSVKSDFDYFLSSNHTLKSGIAFTLHAFTPRAYYSRDEALSMNTRSRQNYKTKEGVFYLEDHWQVTENMIADIGLRIPHLATSEKSYTTPEPRVHLYYTIADGVKLNAGYTRTNQFMHLLSNTGVGLPTDLWVPVNSSAPPQQGDQISAGISKGLMKNKYLISVETYRRNMKNIVAYKQGAIFLQTDELSEEIHWENNIAIGNGESYGTEFFFEKKVGKFTGWAGYTLSWVIHEFQDINNGKRYFPRQDSRHNIVLFWNYRISDRVRLSASWMYSTGNALTVPQSYYYGNFATGSDSRIIVLPDRYDEVLTTEELNSVPYVGSMNSFRGAAYHRLDLSVQLHKRKKHYDRYWEFGLFNAYNRKNPFYYYLESSNDFVNKGQRIDLKKKSLFPILPSVSYNFKF